MLDEPLYWCLESLGTNYVSLCYPLGDALCEKLKKKTFEKLRIGKFTNSVNNAPQLALTCLKLTIETLEQGVK